MKVRERIRLKKILKGLKEERAELDSYVNSSDWFKWYRLGKEIDALEEQLL